MVWESVTVSSGAIMPSSSMQAIQDNMAAIANADAGAPVIQPAGVDSGFSADHLAWVTASAVGNLPGRVNFTLNPHAMFPQVRVAPPSGEFDRKAYWYMAHHSTRINSAEEPRFSLIEHEFQTVSYTTSWTLWYRYLP